MLLAAICRAIDIVSSGTRQTHLFDAVLVSVLLILKLFLAFPRAPELFWQDNQRKDVQGDFKVFNWVEGLDGEIFGQFTTRSVLNIKYIPVQPCNLCYV